MKVRTVHAHFSQLYARHPGTTQTTLTALAVGALWQSALLERCERCSGRNGLGQSD